MPAIAIDTTKVYAEIDLGILSPGNQTWNTPYSSDWAISVGDFGAAPDVDMTPPTAPTNLSAQAL